MPNPSPIEKFVINKKNQPPYEDTTKAQSLFNRCPQLKQQDENQELPNSFFSSYSQFFFHKF